MRFGGAKPETLEIRGARALLFENNGEITVYWQEGRYRAHGHFIAGPEKAIRPIEDLL